MKSLVLLIFCNQLLFLLVQSAENSPIVSANKANTNKAYEIMRYAKSAEIQNLMNNSVDPCQNFYEYACGNWARINPARTEAKTGIFQTLSNAYDRRVLKLLQAPKVSSESDMERKVKYFFDSCLNRDEVRHNYREKLLSIMEEFGGMPALKGNKWNAPEFDWLNVVAEILRKYGKQIIIGVDVSADLTNNQRNRIYIGQPEQVVSSNVSEYYNRLFLEYQMEMQLVLNMSRGAALSTAKSIVDFEKALAVGMSDPLIGLAYQDKTKMRALEDMSKIYEPTLNYTRFVSTWLGYDYKLLVYEYVESYQANLKKVIEKTPKSVIANFIMWELIRDFRLEVKKTEEEQKFMCIAATKRFFVKYLDNMFYRKLQETNENIRDEVEQVFNELKQNFEDILLSKTSSWLSETTRDKALEKLSAMSLAINSYENDNFDKQYGDATISTESYFDNVVNILEQRGRFLREKLLGPPKLDSDDIMNFTPAYSAELNTILMPVAFLQPRFLWDPVYPAAIKYATAGYVIAHEIAHGFDDNVRQFDAKGNLNNWWDQLSTDEFLKRKECLSQHYSEYKFANKLMPRSNAQDENIADNVGIRVAFAAYKKWLRHQSQGYVENTERLPILSLTPQKLFFITLAQVWCTDVHEQIRPYLATIDVHAPEEIRVLAMMSNFDEFSDAFECKEGTRMNPQRKCVMY